MATSREIFQQIKQEIRFQRDENESNTEKESHYTEIGNTLLRISNHCTWLYVWDNFLECNPKKKGHPIVSIVFEDKGNTFSHDNLVLKRYRRRPIKVMEYVYPIHGQDRWIQKEDIDKIIKSIKQISGYEYKDTTGKCNEPELRVSENPPSRGDGPTDGTSTEESINDCLQRQYEMMCNLGCMSRELYERLIHES